MTRSWHIASVWERQAFWQELDDRLTRLANRLTPQQVETACQTVDRRIPRPDPTEIRVAEEEWAEDRREFDKIWAGRGRRREPAAC